LAHTLLAYWRGLLATGFPNLIYREKQVPKVLEWLATAKAVGVDIETYGVAKLKGAHQTGAVVCPRPHKAAATV
jgi:hypothetical protein